VGAFLLVYTVLIMGNVVSPPIPPLSEVSVVEIPEVRPGRFWYGVAAAVAGGGVFFGLILAGATIFYGVSVLPDDTTYFEKESSFSWRVDAGMPQAVFLEESSKFSDADIRDIQCHARALNNSGKLVFRRYRNPVVVNDERPLFEITASRTDEFYISCKGLPHATYAIGKPVTSNMKKMVTALGYSIVVVPSLAFIAAAAITVVVAIKRRNYRRQIQPKTKSVI
jgi:hypothetical protein